MNKKKIILSVTAGILFSTGLGGYFIYSQGNQEGQEKKEKIEKIEKKADTKKDKKTILSKEEKDQVKTIQLEEQSTSAISHLLSGDEQFILNQIRSEDTSVLLARADRKESPVIRTSVDSDTSVFPITPENPEKPNFPNLPPVPENPGTPGGEIEPPDVDRTPPTLETQPLSFHVGSLFTEDIVRQSVVAYDKDGRELTPFVQIDLSRVNQQAEGTYPIVYRVTDGHQVTTTVTNYVTVLNVAPEIRHAVDRRIHVNETFSVGDALRGVTVYDYEEGDLTHRLQVDPSQLQTIQGALRRKIEGQYPMTYKVSDSYGKSDQKVVMITIVNDAPELSGLTPMTIHLGQEFTIEHALEGVSASDTEDGDISSFVQVNQGQLVAIQEALTGTEEGRFELTYSVKDSSGKETTGIRTVNIVNDRPEITLVWEERTIVIGESFDPLEGVSAYDTEDGDLTDQLVVTGHVDTEIIGTTVLSYDVTDSRGKKAETKQVIIHVVEKESEETE